MDKIFSKVNDFPNLLESSPATVNPKKILMVDPIYFDIKYSINPHMKDMYGNLNIINKNNAKKQWNNLKSIYTDLGFEVFVLNGVENLPDMVFCANHSFPYVDRQKRKSLVLSNMHSDIRQKEVPHIAEFFKEQGYIVDPLAERDSKHFFESTGDALWVPGLNLILGGYGFRTNREVYSLLAEKTNANIAIFKLIHPKFYHLDTCLSVINQTSALYCPDAFDEDGRALLHKIFSNLIEVPLHEADSPGFACNAHSPDQTHVILQKGNPQTHEKLVQRGFIPIEVETSEFIKAGGSVFCMKLMFF